MDRPLGKRRVDQRGEVAPEHPQLRHVARDVFLTDLLGQQPHGRRPRVKGLQRIRAQQRPVKAELTDLRLHLTGPLLIQHTEADAVRATEQALPRRDHRDPREACAPFSLEIIREARDPVLRPHQAGEHGADLSRAEKHHRFHTSVSFPFPS